MQTELIQQIVLYICAIGYIIGQFPHTKKVFESISKLDDKYRPIQGFIMAALTDTMIAVFIYIDKLLYASIGVVILIIINVYYYTEDYWLDPYWAETDQRKKSKADGKRSKNEPQFIWRYNFMKILFSVLIPVSILIMSILVHS